MKYKLFFANNRSFSVVKNKTRIQNAVFLHLYLVLFQIHAILKTNRLTIIPFFCEDTTQKYKEVCCLWGFSEIFIFYFNFKSPTKNMLLLIQFFS